MVDHCHQFLLTNDADVLKTFNIGAALRVLFDFELNLPLSRVLKQVSEHFFIDLYHLNSNRVLNLKVLLQDVIEDLPDSPRHKAFASLAVDVVTIQGVGLATASLAVCKNGAVVALHDVLNHLLADYVEDFLLASLGTEDVIESKCWVDTVCQIFFLETNTLLIIAIEDHLLLLGIELDQLFLDLIVGPESSHDFD